MKYVILLTLSLLAGCGALDLPNGKSWPTGSIVEHDSGLLSKDKGLHFLLGMGTSTVTTEVLRHTTSFNYKQRRVYGCAASTTVGVAKELYDKNIMGTRFEVLDAVYTAAGCLFAYRRVF